MYTIVGFYLYYNLIRIYDFVFIEKSKPSIALSVKFMANFWLNLLSEMESLTTDDNNTLLLLTRVVDMDFGLVHPFFTKDRGLAPISRKQASY